MVSVTFNKDYTFNGVHYQAGQIALIDRKWLNYLVDKKIVRLTHKKDADKLLIRKGQA